MLGLKKQHFGPDFQDRWWVDRHSDGEQGELRMSAGPVVPQSILTIEVLQSALETQSLEWILKKKIGVSRSRIDLFPKQKTPTECTNQKARAIVQEASKTTQEIPLHEGRVLWGNLVRRVRRRVPTALQP